MFCMKKLLILIAISLVQAFSCDTDHASSEVPQNDPDYSDMDNWAFHPKKEQTLLSDSNLDIAIINEQLDIDSMISNPNNAAINTGVDVFFVHPTVLSQVADPPQNIGIDDKRDFLIAATIFAQGGLLARYGRFFAPRYRQSTASTYQSTTSKELQASVISMSYSDVKAAFMDYMTNYNHGNRIITEPSRNP